MADISKIKLPDNTEYTLKDDYLRDAVGEFDSPYVEVEWVESTGVQFIELDWRPGNGWGFDADFIVRNAFNTTTHGWDSTTNSTKFGTLFGVRDSSGTNDYELSTYSPSSSYKGYLKVGSGGNNAALKTDGSRQQCSLRNTTYTMPDGTTKNVSKTGATAAQGICIFAFANAKNLGSIVESCAMRLYSLKFYDGNNLEVDLVGAYRKEDGCTGLYDKVSKHFYASNGMLKGEDVGDIGDTQSVNDAISGEMPYVTGTHTVATRLWTGNINISELNDGQRFTFVPQYGGLTEAKATELVNRSDSGSSANLYMKLSLKSGTQTEWWPCYTSTTSRQTTHFGAGATLTYTYRENVLIGSTPIPRGFWVDSYYDSNDVNYNNRECYGLRKTAGHLGRYLICFTKSDGTLVPVNDTDNNITKTKTLTTETFDPFGEIFYWSAATNYSANAVVGNSSLYRQYHLVDLRYSFNCGGYNAAGEGTLTSNLPLYLVCVPQSDGTVKLHSSPLSQALPSADDGLLYMYFGRIYNDTYPYRLSLALNHPIYWYKNGKIVPYIKDPTTAHVARYSNTNGNNSGKYYKISINSYNSWMLNISVKLYHTYRAYDLMVSGYNYGSTHWYSPAATILGASVTNTVAVTFGYDSDWHLWFAIPAEQYSGVAVSLGANGYYSVTDETNLFTIEMVEGLPETVQSTITAYRPWYRNELSGTSPIGFSNGVISHANSGVTAASKGDTSNQTPGFGSTFKALSGTVNATGHLTSFADHTVKIPDTKASTSAYGITKLSTSTSSTATDLAATPSAVKVAKDRADEAYTKAATAESGLNGTLIYDHSYAINNGVATFTPHVYLKGAEVTSNYAKSCFVWKYKLANDVTGTPSYIPLTTNDDRTCTVTISVLGYGGYVLGEFTPA